jgi:hypothetical protein
MSTYRESVSEGGARSTKSINLDCYRLTDLDVKDEGCGGGKEWARMGE